MALSTAMETSRTLVLIMQRYLVDTTLQAQTGTDDVSPVR
jgi:hypothetical protein